MSKQMRKKICAKCGERPAHGNSKFCNECRLENKRDYRKKYRREVRHGLKYVPPESFEDLVEWCKTEGIREIVGRLAK